MELDTNQKEKILSGLILGEIYRIQKKLEMVCPVRDATIYGLLNGFEDVIDEQIELTGFISSSDVQKVCDILDKSPGLKNLRYIEYTLKNMGIDKFKAERILTYLLANGQYAEIIENMEDEFEIPDYQTQFPQPRSSTNPFLIAT